MKHSEFSLLADYIYDIFGIKVSDNKMNIFEMLKNWKDEN